MNLGNTPVDLQDAIISELNDNLFKGELFRDIEGGQKELTVYPQDLPIPETNDDSYASNVNVPYAIVRISQGEISETSTPAEIDIIIILCVFDDENNKQAYRDVIHIINKIQQRFMINPIVGNFRFKGPFKWALQDNNETYPYFFGGIEMTFESSTAFVVEDKFS